MMLCLILFSTIRLGHTGMTVEEIVENTLAVAEVLAEKLPMVLPYAWLKIQNVALLKPLVISCKI